MANRIIPLLILIVLCFGCESTSSVHSPAGPADGWHPFGGAEQSAPESTVKELRHYEGKVSVEGSIIDVCQTMGCWLNIRDRNGDELFVMTKDHDYFIPRNAAGRPVRVVGSVRTDTFTVEELRHIAADAGKPPVEIAAITQPQTRTYFIADSVSIQGSGLDKPAHH
jgi:hypothetical protein